MTRKHTPARAPAHGLKMAIGAAAIAATLGGWAALAAEGTPTTAAEVAAPPDWLLEPPPIPTLLPVADLPQRGPDAGAVAPAPALGEVSAPPLARPRPVAITRSSR
jgi:hypothetical protein